MEYTLADAAKAAKVNKSTLFRAVKRGRLSARRIEDGSYRIDASELARIYDLQHLARNGGDALQRSAIGADAPAIEGTSATEVIELRIRVEMLQEQLTRERELRDQERETNQETVTDLRKRLDRAEERILALAAPAAPERPQVGPSRASAGLELSRSPRGLLNRLWGR